MTELQRGVAHHVPRRLAVLRREPIVQRDAVALVLEHQALVPLGKNFDGARRFLQFVHRKWIAMNAPERIAPLDAVLSCGRQLEGRDDLVDALERAPAHQRERAAGRLVELLDQADVMIFVLHRLGRLGDFEQRAVEIQEERRPRLERRSVRARHS